MVKIIAGLGNIGLKYENTRHNIGFMVLDSLAEHFEINFSSSDKFNCFLSEKIIAGNKVFFIKPTTFMNNSGVAVASVANFYKISISDIFILHDEMNLPYGTIKLRHKGSAGGHNGLTSIIECLGSSDFPRLKMGIGKVSGEDAVSHVLGKFTAEEKEILDDFIIKGKNASLDVINYGIDHAMITYNR